LFEKYPLVAQYSSHWQHDLIWPYEDLPSYGDLVGSGKMDVLNYKNRPNVVGTWRGSGKDGKSLILNGHIDPVTFEPRSEWTHDPFGAEITNGKMFGPGWGDQVHKPDEFIPIDSMVPSVKVLALAIYDWCK
jgi:acetylornithine deacetylase